jgi:L-ascorbate metabolism protein UlaG (beta-lactamase superfamily)
LWAGAISLLALVALLMSGCAAPTEAAVVTSVPSGGGTSDADLPALLSELHALGHASFRLDGPPTVYFDPTSAGSEAPPADVILISHEHRDHYHPATLTQISTPQTVILTNERVAAELASAQGVEGEVRVMQAGDVETLGEVEIEAVPAYNLSTSYHPREAGGLGFVVAWGGERLYFAGDTDRIPEMADIDCDVALLPIGGKYTMDVKEAAQATADIAPRVAVPMHARSADPERFRSLCDCTVVLLEP